MNRRAAQAETTACDHRHPTGFRPSLRSVQHLHDRLQRLLHGLFVAQRVQFVDFHL
jgi:hypothetical protein